MTKLSLTLLSLCILFSSCRFSTSDQHSKFIDPEPPPVKKEQAIDWKEFVTEEGRFKIIFPAPPTQTFNDSETPNGKVRKTIWEATFRGEFYDVRYGDFPGEPDVDQNNLKPYYDLIRDNTIRLQASTLLSERDVFVNQNLGRELVTEYNGLFVKFRLFLIGRRIYQTSARTTISRKDEKEFQSRGDRFLDSFGVIEK